MRSFLRGELLAALDALLAINVDPEVAEIYGLLLRFLRFLTVPRRTGFWEARWCEWWSKVYSIVRHSARCGEKKVFDCPSGVLGIASGVLLRFR